MFDFPSAPSNGQQVTAPNGAVYAWNGTSWAPVSIGLPAYAPLNAPVFTGDARAVTPAYGDNDTSIPTTAFVQSAVAPVANNTGRNLVMNGAYNIWQRGVGAFTSGSSYTADRWVMYVGTDTSQFGRFSLSDSNRAAIGDESATYAMQCLTAGNAAAGSFTQLCQMIEGVRRLSGKMVTLSFYAVAGVAGLRVGASIDQIFGTGGSPSATVLGTGQSVALTTSFARYSMTFSLPSTSGATLGTNGDDSTRLALWFSAGSSFNSRSGSVGVQSGNIWIWGAQLEIGTQATPFDAGGTPADQLRQCQRFFQVGQIEIAGYQVASGSFIASAMLPVTMRAIPTITPTWVTQTNVSGPLAQSFYPYSMRIAGGATGAGTYDLAGTFTASADL